MEEKIRIQRPRSPRVSANVFSVVRPDAGAGKRSAPGITIQVRLKNTVPARLLSRKNTEFWLSATD